MSGPWRRRQAQTLATEAYRDSFGVRGGGELRGSVRVSAVSGAEAGLAVSVWSATMCGVEVRPDGDLRLPSRVTPSRHGGRHENPGKKCVAHDAGRAVCISGITGGPDRYLDDENRVRPAATRRASTAASSATCRSAAGGADLDATRFRSQERAIVLHARQQQLDHAGDPLLPDRGAAGSAVDPSQVPSARCGPPGSECDSEGAWCRQASTSRTLTRTVTRITAALRSGCRELLDLVVGEAEVGGRDRVFDGGWS